MKRRISCGTLSTRSNSNEIIYLGRTLRKEAKGHAKLNYLVSCYFNFHKATIIGFQFILFLEGGILCLRELFFVFFQL